MPKPTTTCDSECCRRIMRLVPTAPESTITKQNHHIGLKVKIMANASKAPATPPIAAEWVDIFHHILMSAQTT